MSTQPDGDPLDSVPVSAYLAVERERNEAQALAEYYRSALVSIADQQSGVWGQIARKALDDVLASSVQR